jgi:outer membrane receptor protein involved in Fe transport
LSKHRVHGFSCRSAGRAHPGAIALLLALVAAAAPAQEPAAAPSPFGPGYDEAVTTLPDFLIQGREDDLTGVAQSASQGTVGSSELADRPILRTGELLETIPGMIITQHAGGGKANQYFTRGFNLDHGTDFSLDLDGVPLNLPSHAHGQGYADLNGVIPELVDRIDFEKGPYYAANGDFSTVGAAHLILVDSLPADLLKVEAGAYGYSRAVVAGSAPVGAETLLWGFEAYHDDGPWVVPDDYVRLNGLLKLSGGSPASGYSLMAMAYHGTWNSTDQVSESAVGSGEIPFFGSQSPTDGGYSERLGLEAEWHRKDGDSSTQAIAYAYHYDLNLFSDFTYFLDSPEGDQFEQEDNRSVAGLRFGRTVAGEFLRRRMENTIGLQAQDSSIDLGLYQTVDRVRTGKVSYDGQPIPAETKVDAVREASAGVFFDDRIWWAERFRTDLGFREDVFGVSVSDLDPSNSGNRAAAHFGPKLSLIFGPWKGTEAYLQGGYGFHSNDARAVTASENPDGSVVGTHLPLLVPAMGAEAGVRSAAVNGLQSTISVWCLHNDSELYFDGIDADSGETTASQQATNRYGVEFANYYTPVAGLTLDLDYSDSRARFVSPTTAAEDPTPGGTLVDEAVHRTLAAGATVRSRGGWETSLRLRYFGPRPLTSTGSVSSASTLIVNLGAGYRINRSWRVTGEVLNLLDRRDHDIDYYYQSRNSPAPGAPSPL